ncbi:hypothetical protein [Pseudactinotalea terrae]|uniref:hypothetical protein n=1 Tax=Pseudactinotalea terrae TaxID=1743262 RepID=UPI0012E20F59|nr:hypothetical protein [Pseudactinotalea terrae]
MAAPVAGLLRLGVTAGLAVSAVVHWQLAEPIGLAAPGGIGGETLFRLQALAAALVALAVLVTGRWWAHAAALLVAGASLVAVLASTWFEIPAMGPVPSMYDPMWYPAKTASAVAEGLTVLLAAAALVRAGRHQPRPRPYAAGPARTVTK